MSLCPMTAACTFFTEQMADMPGMAKLIQSQYCNADFRNCARFVLSSARGMDAVPGTLFPGHLDKAKFILAEGDR